MRSEPKTHDVIILGAGIAGTMLGCILARNGVKVLLIDAYAHPRFAIGESTIPLSTLVIEFLAERFGVPEFNNLTDPALYQKHIGTTCGVKSNFGYVYHAEGRTQHPEQAQQLGASRFYRHDELHLYRQDTDSYLFHTAIRYGAEARQNTVIQTLDIDDAGVHLVSTTGERFESRYLVDATGYRSVLADKYGLREQPTRLKHHSRSVFTHMIDVAPYDAVADAGAYHQLPSPWHKGTLHHLFDGGWMWVIPFNNVEGSTNPLVSVGLNVDPRRYPKNGATPEEEFQNFLARFPEVGKQFAQAKRVREWVSTDRLQYSSTTSIGDRWCLMSHASGFVDPFYSRGLINTMEVMHAFASRMLKAVHDGDFSAERFRFVDELQQKQIDHNDRLVNCSYIAFRDYELWNAFLRVWVLGTYGSEGWFQGMVNAYRKKQDRRILEQVDHPKHPGVIFPFGDWFKNLFEAACSTVEAVERGEIAPKVAAQRLFSLMREADYSDSGWLKPKSAKLFEAIRTPSARDMFYRPENETGFADSAPAPIDLS